MTSQDLREPPILYIEISQTEMKIRQGAWRGWNLPLDRSENGHLTPQCRDQLIQTLRSIVKPSIFHQKIDVLCAIAGRGVSIRRIEMPVAPTEDLQQLLQFQVEKEFPLAPEELAWGQIPIKNRAASAEQFLLVALKRDLIAEYSDLFSECGFSPHFTIAALARIFCLREPPQDYGVLELNDKSSEFLRIEDGHPASIRTLSGLNNLPGLAAFLKEQPPFPLFVTGIALEAPALQRLLPERKIEIVEVPRTEGQSSAIVGMLLTFELSFPLVLLTDPKDKPTNLPTRSHDYKWAAVAIILALACLGLQYGNSLLYKHRISKKYEELKGHRLKAPELDRQLAFLQFMKTNQPSYLDALHTLSSSAPRGVKVESLTMNRRGEVSFRGAMRDAQQMVEFRSKMIDSGGFTNVVVEEQTPTQDRQKLNVRISAQWTGNAKAPTPAAPKDKPGVPRPPSPAERALTIVTP